MVVGPRVAPGCVSSPNGTRIMGKAVKGENLVQIGGVKKKNAEKELAVAEWLIVKYGCLSREMLP